MPMRITNQMISNGFLKNLRTNLRGLDGVNRQLSSGKAISRPSDDPVRLQQILKLDTALSQRNQYVRNIEDADSWLTATDAALKQVGDVVIRVKELGIKASNGTNDVDSSNAIALEIGQLLEHLGEVANTVFAGRYVFAGSDTEHQPYQIDMSAGSQTDRIMFSAQTQDVEYEIGQDAFIKVNTTGQDAFGGRNLFVVLDDMRRAVSGEVGLDLDDALGRLDSANQTLLAARADVGARMNRLEATKTRYEDDIINMTALKSKAEDADIAQVVMELKTKETVYQAALAAGAKIIQPSLLDYMR